MSAGSHSDAPHAHSVAGVIERAEFHFVSARSIVRLKPLHSGHDVSVRFDDEEDELEIGRANVSRAPICGSCGVTALPAHRSNVIDTHFVCDNDGCDAFGEPV